jgi:Ca2+-binding RTX toxin-like protein
MSLINGTNNNDSLTGGTGNDTLVGGAGNDTIDGGAGFNVVEYAGSEYDYIVTRQPNGSVTVRAIAGTRSHRAVLVSSCGPQRMSTVTRSPWS